MIRLLIGLLLLSGPTLADNLRYTNERFGTTANIPFDLLTVSGSQNGDGVSFQRIGLKGTIRVFGSNFVIGDTAEEYKQFLVLSERQGGAKVGHVSLKNGIITVVSSRGALVNYLRVKVCKDGPLHHIQFEYPDSERTVWDIMINSYAATLDGPCG
jgi:hypothetical protein